MPKLIAGLSCRDLPLHFSVISLPSGNEVSSSTSGKKGLREGHNHSPPIILGVHNIKQIFAFSLKTYYSKIFFTDILRPGTWLVVSLASIMLFFFH